jgi:hypothetical protein
MRQRLNLKKATALAAKFGLAPNEAKGVDAPLLRLPNVLPVLWLPKLVPLLRYLLLLVVVLQLQSNVHLLLLVLLLL